MSPTKVARGTLESVIPKLAKAIKLRKIRLAMRIVGEWIDQLDTLPLSQKSAIPLLGYCAWALDFYGPYINQVEGAVARFKQLPNRDLTLCELAHLNVAAGLVNFHRGNYGEAKALFKQAQKDADRANNTELIIVSRYYRARALWKQTNYKKALKYINDAIEREDPKNNAMLATMELVKGWLLFLKADIKEAKRVLDDARARLDVRADASVDLGNICSFQGRIYREDGKYPKALKRFSEAIRYYRKHDLGHRNIARSRLNKAFVYRILARDLDRTPVSKDLRPRIETKVEKLRGKAFAELKQAQEIYEFDPNRNARGLGKLHSIRALLYFDSCEYEQAETEAKRSYDYGRDKSDKMVMADARIIQSTLVLERGEGIDPQLALDLAEEAIKLAEQTGHRRLRARAYIREGLALLELDNPFKAEECWKEAQSQLVPEDKDYLRASLESLEKGIRSKWHSSSLISRITFERVKGEPVKELSSEIEEEILRFIYERSRRNATKTASELKTTPREVREAVSTFKITEECLKNLRAEKFDKETLEQLTSLKNREVQGRAKFVSLLIKTIGLEPTRRLKTSILKHVHKFTPPT